jgi:hypothetical protein
MGAGIGAGLGLVFAQLIGAEGGLGLVFGAALGVVVGILVELILVSPVRWHSANDRMARPTATDMDEESKAGRPVPAADSSKPVRFKHATRLLLSDRLVVRFAALFALAAAGFLIAQTIAYLWLPQGFLRGASIGAVVAGNEAAGSFMIEWARIIAWNLLVLGLVFVAPNLLRLASGIPLGYLPAITMTAYMGIITGTNSFTMAAEVGKIAPSLEWLANPGFYELAAYVLAAAATYEIARWQVVTVGGKESIVRFYPVHGGWRSRQLWLGLMGAVAVVLAANAWEAQRILAL